MHRCLPSIFFKHHTSTFMAHAICQACAKCFTCTISLTPCEVVSLCSFYRKGTKGLERWFNSLKIRQPACKWSYPSLCDSEDLSISIRSCVQHDRFIPIGFSFNDRKDPIIEPLGCQLSSTSGHHPSQEHVYFTNTQNM